MTLRRRLAHLLSYWAVLLDPNPETISGMDDYAAFCQRLADERNQRLAADYAAWLSEHRGNVTRLKR